MAEQARHAWVSRSGWDGIVEAGSFGAPSPSGLSVRRLEGLGLASLIAAPGGGLERRLRDLTGLDLPRTPVIVRTDRHAVVWSGPGRWLLLARQREGFAALCAALADVAAVSEQSDARLALRLSGPQLRAVLAKGVMLDLHPAAFAVDAAAQTSIAHVGVQIWREPDDAGGSVFELLVPRSMAGSLWSWLSASAAEFGCTVTADRG